MALSGTYTFNLDINDIVEEAYERCGTEFKTGYQLRTAKRALDLMLLDWVNDGINLWTIDQTTVALVDGTSSYTLNAQWLDVLDAVVRDSDSVDTPLTRITLGEYLQIPKKTQKGVPNQFCLERNSSGGHTLRIYPTADASYTFVTWGIRYIQDAGAYTNNIDVPRRFLPALVAGLAYYLSAKSQSLAVPLVDEAGLLIRRSLKQDYLELYNRAKSEDRDRSSFFILPARRY